MKCVYPATAFMPMNLIGDKMAPQRGRGCRRRERGWFMGAKRALVRGVLSLALAAGAWTTAGSVLADEASQQAELAKKLQNPIADLISAPIQNNWDFGIGPADAMRYTVNVQPIIPISLSEDWLVVTRTILPTIYAESPVRGGRDHWGLGDTLQSFFFQPKAGVGGWIVGAGPALQYPTATDSALGSGKWGAGPTAVVVRQRGPWSLGLLANHVWSYAGWGDTGVSATFVQPFVSYTTKTHTTLGLTSEFSYDWCGRQWTVPINLTLSQLFKVGHLPVQVGLGPRIYAERPKGGPDWGFRFTVTLLLPK